jgi:integrase
VKLTEDRIEALECPAGKKDVFVFDSEQRGLGVRVTAGAKKGSKERKSFLAQYRHARQKRRIPIGSCTAISLKKARAAVQAIMGDVAHGRDPAAERKQAALEAVRKAETATLAAIIAQWAALHLNGKRPNYANAAVATLTRVFAKHLKRPATALDRANVVRRLDALAHEGKAQMAAMAARYGSALYGWALKRGSVEANPFARVPIAPIVSRDRVLSDEEIYQIWAATVGPGAFNGIMRGLLLTGARREEVAGMTWDEIAPDLSAWTLPAARSKNGLPHVVPLSAQMQDLLRSRPRIQGCNLAFAGERGVFSGWSKSKHRLDNDSGTGGWTLHDLRRTVATRLADDLAVQPHVIEAILNHVSGHKAGVAGVYNKASYGKEKLAALNSWGEYVAAIVEGRQAGANVVAFTRSG